MISSINPEQIIYRSPHKEVAADNGVELAGEVNHAINEAATGSGFAWIDNVPIPEGLQNAINAGIEGLEWETSPNSDSVKMAMLDLTQSEAKELSTAFGLPMDITLIHPMLIRYERGNGMDPHTDFAEITNVNGREYLESLSVLYHLDGPKHLGVRTPEGTEDRFIEQVPKRLILFRGGSFTHNQKTYHAIEHWVPPVTDKCLTFTADVTLNNSLSSD